MKLTPEQIREALIEARQRFALEIAAWGDPYVFYEKKVAAVGAVRPAILVKPPDNTNEIWYVIEAWAQHDNGSDVNIRWEWYDTSNGRSFYLNGNTAAAYTRVFASSKLVNTAQEPMIHYHSTKRSYLKITPQGDLTATKFIEAYALVYRIPAIDEIANEV